MSIVQTYETSWLRALGCLNEFLQQGQSIAVTNRGASSTRYAILFDDEGFPLNEWRGCDALGAIAVAATKILTTEQLDQFLKTLGDG